MSTLRLLSAAAIVALALAGPVHAAGNSDSSGSQAYTDGKKAANAQDWPTAIALFTQATEEDPEDADAWNMLAYSQRNAGDVESALANYDKALAIDPDHKDAHEYMGEAYLQMGDVAAAEAHLARLDEICWLGCEQKDELAEAIAAWKAENGG